MAVTDLAFKLFAIDEASPVFGRVAKSAEASGLAVEGAGKKHAAAGAAVKKFATGGTIAVAAIGVASLKMAADFEESLTTLVTGAGESKKNIKMVGDGIKSLALSTNTSTKDLVDGMYQIESAGYHGKAGLDVLKQAAEGAKVGNAQLGDVANGVTTIMTDYKDSHINATQATNGLIKAVSSGKTHMQDLATSMATIAPIAATTGVKMSEMLGAMAELTSRGVPAAQASTMLKQTLINLKSPSTIAQKTLKSLGISGSTVSNMLGKKGLAATFEFLNGKMKKHHLTSAQSVTALKNISGGSKTLMGSLILSGKGLDGFKEKTKAITDATGKSKKGIQGWGEVQKNLNFKIDSFVGVVQDAVLTVGQQLLPVFASLIDKVTPFLPILIKVVAAFLALAVIAKIVIMISKMVEAFVLFAKAARFAAVGMGLVNAEMDANPIGLVVLGIAALIAAIVWIAVKTTWFQTIWKYTWGGIKTAGLAVWHALQSAFHSVVNFLHGKWGWLIAFMGPVGWMIAIYMHWKQIWGAIKASALAVWGALKSAWHAVTSSLTSAWKTSISAISNFGKAVWGAIWGFLKGLWNTIKGAFKSWLTGEKNFWVGIWKAVSNFGRSIWANIWGFLKGIWSTIASYFKSWLTGNKNFWVGTWKAISSFGTSIWHSISDRVLGTFRNVRDSLKGIWNSVVSTAKSSWQKVQSAVMSPVRFVVNTVIGGLARAWNTIVGKVGLGSLKLPVPHVGFAAGGYVNLAGGGAVHGPGGPKADKIPAMLSNGEYVIPAHVVKARGVEFFDSMLGKNAKMASRMPFTGGDPSTIKGYAGIPNPIHVITGAAKKVGGAVSGALGGVKDWVLGTLTKGIVSKVIEAPFKAMLGHIPGGGVVGSLMKEMVPKLLSGLVSLFMKKNDAASVGGTLPYHGSALNWAKSQAGKRYQWGGNGNPSWDCSGFMSAIESVIRGEHPHRRWATGAFSGSSGPPGWHRNAQSAFKIGITNAGVGHTAGTLGGVNVECRGGAGCIVGGHARGFNDHLFTSHWGLKLPGVKGFAQGGLAPRGWSMVGELGPELVYSQSGAKVLSNRRSNSMLAGVGGGGGGHLGTVEVVVRTEDGREIERKLVTLKHRRGGRKFSWESK